MMKRLILLLLVLASLSFAQSLDRSVFMLDYVDADFGHGCQYYTVTNPLTMDVAISKPSMAVAHKTTMNTDIWNDGWEVLMEVQKERTVHIADIVCHEVNENETTVEVCEDQGYDTQETYYADEWTAMPSTYTFEASKATELRYCADYDMEYAEDKGWFANIDVVPSFAGHSYPEYAWWNTSWAKCMQINISGGFPVNYTHYIKLNTTNFNYSNAQDDLDDLRFLQGACEDYNKTAGVLSEWDELVNTSGESHIWVRTKTADISSLALYYNNTAASSVFNITNTFIFADDFDDGTIDTSKWTTSDAPSESGGNLILDNDDAVVSILTVAPADYEGDGLQAVGYMDADEQDITFLSFYKDGTNYISLSNSDSNPPMCPAGDLTCLHLVTSKTGSATYNQSTSTLNITNKYRYDIIWTEDWAAAYQNETYTFNNSDDLITVASPIRLSVWDSSQESTLTVDWVAISIYLGAEPTYSFGEEEEAPSLDLSIIPPDDCNETENESMSINISSTEASTNITAYSVHLYYNNTLVMDESASGVNQNSFVFTPSVVAPLVDSNNTDIPWEVYANATINGIGCSQNDTDNQTVDLWYYFSKYTYTKANEYTVEASNSINITTPSKPASAPDDVTYDGYSYSYANCTKHYADDSDTNITCTSSLSITDISNFIVYPSHLKEDGVIYMDFWMDREYNLSFNATNESTSSKTISGITNTTKDYFVWLVNSTNGSIDGAGNLSTVFYTTFYDEEDLSSIDIDSVAISYTVLFSDGEDKTFYVSYADAGAVSNSTVRGYPDWYEATLNSTEVYSKASYTTRSRFLVNAETNLSTQQNVSVYMLPSSGASYAIINVVDNGEPVIGAYIQILKFYASENLYLNIEQKITNSEGRAPAYIDADAYYKFAVFDSSGTQTYISVQPEQFICDTTCEITINIAEQTDINILSPYVAATCYGTNATNTITFTYADATGLTDQMRFLAWRDGGTTPVCNQTVNGSSGSYACVLSDGENLSNYMYVCEVQYATSPFRPVYLGLIDFRIFQGITDWALVAFALVIVLGAAAFHISIGIGLAAISLFALSTLEIIAINEGTAIMVLISGLVLAYLLARSD